ncbi:MAG: hypothetical protein HOV81_18180 [Kofleriaceae bacterium]|nr:hypothetical protein [Kofleriaceae bacterium]
MRAHLVVVVAAVAVAGCTKDKSKVPTPTPTSPVSTAEQDALWAFAPEGANIGIVISPKGVGMLEGAAIDLDKLAAQAPEIAKYKAEFDKKLEEVLGTSSPTLATAGLTSKKGAALFGTMGEKDAVAIVPVADRDKFIAVTKGTKGADGVDTIGKATCKTVNGSYVCVENVASFDRLGTGKGALRKQLIDVAGARGDIEIAVNAPEKEPILVGAVVQLDRGMAVIRGAVKGVPPKVSSMLGNVKPRTEGDNTSGFAVLNVKPMLQQIPAMPIAPGVGADELARSIDGPVTLSVAAGSTMFDLRVPLNDPAPAQKLIDQCDQFPPLAKLGATVANGTCTVPFAPVQMTIEAWVDGKTLRIGEKQPKATHTTAPMSAAGKELAGGEWAFAMWGRGTMFTTMKLPPIPVDQLPPEVFAMLRAVVLFNEFGLGVKVDGDKLKFLATLRTAYANPDDVVAKFLAIQPKQFFTGEAGTLAKQIADGAPSSPFAGDFAAGYGGLMVPAAGIGMLSAIAIPAFMDYMKRGKQSEAHLQLNKLAKSAKTEYAVNGEFPKGKVALPPSCCESGGTCSDAAVWQDPVWKALDFSIDEPHRFRYSYESDGKTFTATAVGDLDCDGNEVTYTLRGSSEQGNPTTRLEDPAPNSD